MSRLQMFMGNRPFSNYNLMQRQPRLSPQQLQFQLANLQMGMDRENRRDSLRRSDQRFKFLTDLMRDNQSARNEARQANESRYNDILGSINSGLSGVMGDLEGYGASQRTDLNREFDTRRNNLITDLAERGMSGSTARIPIEMSVAEGRRRGMERIEDLLRERRSGARERFLDRSTGVMERRTDAYPDLMDLSQVSGLLGQLDVPPVDTYGLSGLFNPMMMAQQFAPPQPVSDPQRVAIYNPPPQAPVATQPALTPTQIAAQSQMGQQELARRNALVALKNARESGGAAPGGRLGREREAQNQAILQGFANWSPGQPAPVTPGAPPSLLQGVDPAVYQLGGLLNQLGGYGQPVAARSPRSRPNLPSNPVLSPRMQSLVDQRKRRQARQATIAPAPPVYDFNFGWETLSGV